MNDPQSDRIYLIAIFMLFLCGIGHAKFIMLDIPTSTWAWHLWQWIPLLLGAFSFASIGWVWRFWIPLFMFRPFSFFGKFGLAAAPFASAGLGYVLGYHIV